MRRTSIRLWQAGNRSLGVRSLALTSSSQTGNTDGNTEERREHSGQVLSSLAANAATSGRILAGFGIPGQDG